MLRGGIEAKDLFPICTSSIKRARVRARSNQVNECGGLVTAALVLDAWHRNRRYLSAKGTPRPVRLFGPAPSVEALIRLQKLRKRSSDVARHLKAARLIVPCGGRLYKPASDVAVISNKDPLVLQHAARALSTLLETVGRNLNHTRSLAPLIERFAEVPDLPRRHVKAFQTFTQTQGRTFLRTINDWLESRRVPRSSRKSVNATVRAGIHAYAYIASNRRSLSSSNNRVA